MIAVVGICAMGAAKDVAQANTKAIAAVEIAYITRLMTFSFGRSPQKYRAPTLSGTAATSLSGDGGAVQSA